MTEAVRTTCPYCGVGCGVLAQADGTLRGETPAPPSGKPFGYRTLTWRMMTPR